MKKWSYFKQITTIMSLMTLLLLASSCAEQEVVTYNDQVKNIKQQMSTIGARDMFTQEEIDALYTEETENIGGFIYPISKEPTVNVFLYEEAPNDFKDVWGEFDVGTELRAFMNLGQSPNEVLEKFLVTSFESLSKWKEMEDKDGELFFDDTYSINSQGDQIADDIDGFAGPNGETHKAMLKLNLSGIKIKLEGEVFIENIDGNIRVKFENTKDVKVFLVGTVIKKSDFVVEIIYSPYLNGWLAYGANKLKLNKFKDQVDLEFASEMVQSFYRWFKEETVQDI